MARKLGAIAPDWWDYIALDDDIIRDGARLTPEAMLKLSRLGTRVVMYDTLEDFYLAEAPEHITAWKNATPDNPRRLCPGYSSTNTDIPIHTSFIRYSAFQLARRKQPCDSVRPTASTSDQLAAK